MWPNEKCISSSYSIELAQRKHAVCIDTTLHGVTKYCALWQKFILPIWLWWLLILFCMGMCKGDLCWLVALFEQWVQACSGNEHLFAQRWCTGEAGKPKESLSPDFLICYDLLMMQQSLAAFSNPLPVGCEVCQFQWHRGQGGQWEVSCPSSGVQLCQGLWGGQC